MDRIHYELEELLKPSLERSSAPASKIVRHRVVLVNFLAGRIDPRPDERLLNNRTRALRMGKVMESRQRLDGTHPAARASASLQNQRSP